MRLGLTSAVFIAASSLYGQTILPPVQPTPLEVSRMVNVAGDQVIDNRSQYVGLLNYWGFCATGVGNWSVSIQYADNSSSGPWITPGGSGTVNSYSTTCIGSFYGFHAWMRFHVTGSAVVKYSAVRDFYMPQGGGQISTSLPVIPYTVNATTSPMTILAATHGEGNNVSVLCFAGTLTVDFHVTGPSVLCQYANDGQGNVTVTWYDNTVGSIMVFAAGPGPPGPSGLGANPYVVNSTSSPQTIPQTTHNQGFNPSTFCWAGPLVNGHITGVEAPCTIQMDPTGNGNVIVSWTGSAVGSILVQSSGRPAPYTQNISTSPTTIPITTHNQGFSAYARCFSGPVISGVVTGNEVLCASSRDAAGNITVKFGGASVSSVSIQ